MASTNEQWDRDWRLTITASVEKSADLLDKTVVAAERLDLRLTAIEKWRDNLDLDNKTKPARKDETMRGWLAIIISAAIGLTALACSGLNLLATHIHWQ